MAKPIRCHCTRCRLDGVTGPVVLIMVGVLLLVREMGFRYGFWDLAPIVLILIGLLRLAQALAPATGHLQPGEATPRPGGEATNV